MRAYVCDFCGRTLVGPDKAFYIHVMARSASGKRTARSVTVHPGKHFCEACAVKEAERIGKQAK